MAAPERPDLYAIRQFEIDVLVPIELFGVNMSFTTSAQAMVTTVLLVTAYLVYGIRLRALVPGRLQMSVEALYGFIARTVTETAGPEDKSAIPFVFSLFVFILFGSLIGLTPVKFTFTSHLIVTAALALLVFIYVTALAVRRQGMGFLRFFLPTGTPAYLAPLIFIIEVISYLFRPLTLGVRIFANVVAGHIMIKLFADMCAMLTDALGAGGMVISIAPLLLMAVFYLFEVLVLIVQAYIFILLTCLYIRDAVHSH